MKKTLVTSVALAACVTTQLFAQNAKEDTLTLSLTAQAEASVSTSASQGNAGFWSTGPTYYKSSTVKLTHTDVLRAIAYVLHGKNANYYSSSARLVLVQGELGGFFNISSNLAVAQQLVLTNGTFDTTTFNTANSSTVDGLIIPKLASGRHFEPNPVIAARTDTTLQSSWPVGHHQPWGQIFVKDPSRLLCENVTFFFNVTVQECYDCFYLNSFVTDASFKFNQSTTVDGPPCCVSVRKSIAGSGVDRYYMTLSFDNSDNNPYLNPDVAETYTGFQGISRDTIPGDGVQPDAIDYVDLIASGVGKAQPYMMRWTLNGIVTYSWTLKLLNSTDAAPDYVGGATYPANGYGFVALRCALLNGSASIAEKIVKTTSCCLDLPWYDSWYGAGAYFGSATPKFGAEYPDNLVDPMSPVNDPADLSTHVDFNQQAPRNSGPTSL